MELPVPLRQAIAQALAGIPVADLSEASRRLSALYRSEDRGGVVALDDLAARAYLAVRMPATYAALRACLDRVAEMAPDFAPATQLDAGAGPGTGFFAASDCWPSLARATLIEQSPAMRLLGEQLTGQAASKPVVRWLAADLAADTPPQGPFDLVTAAYVVNELPGADAARLVERLWSVTAGLLVVIEPGTPAGWQRILLLRERLVALGASLLAPCPHALACPLAPPDWCHFAQRLPRSKLHRLSKQAEMAWEDEKYSYLAASRQPSARSVSRILAMPRRGSGQIALKLCRPDGSVARRLVTRREGETFRRARRLSWGEVWTDSAAAAEPD